MTGVDWVDKVKQYRIAVDAYCDAYCDAVDRMQSTGEFGPEWQKMEAARDQAERARMDLLRQSRRPSFSSRSVTPKEIPDYRTEDLVLGDLGQSGG